MRKIRLSLRARLTLIYSAMLILAGVVVLLVTWFLVGQQAGVSVSYGRVPEEALSDPGLPASLIDALNNVRAEALNAILGWGGLAIVLVGILAAWICWLVAGMLLRPLSKITETARRIAEAPAGDLRTHERIGMAAGSEEILELADTFDGMLERLDTSFDAQRRFIANASHELRTPLTLNRALIEVAAQRAGASDDLLLLGDTLLEVNARHERLIDGLLLLARSEATLSEKRFVDLADLAEHVVTRRIGASPLLHVTISTDMQEAPTAGDAVLLEQLAVNLLDNAISHNLPEGGWIRVATRTDVNGGALLEVSNSGKILPAYEVAALFEPFYRAGAQRIAGDRGVGLGLSIVRSIVEAHGGTATLKALPSGGLSVTIRLPAAPYDPEDSTPS